MSQLGARTPITTVQGYQAVTLAGGGWKRLSQVLTIPPEATGALVYVKSGGAALAWMQAVDAIPTSPQGLGAAAGTFLSLNDYTQVAQFCVNGNSLATIAVQFYTGPVGQLPVVVLPLSGGGGGGGVSSVSATAPITSTGGAAPVIGLNDGYFDYAYLAWGGAGWTNVALARRMVLWVDQTYGNDATGRQDQMALPFATINGANAAAAPGSLIIIGPGYYPEDLIAQDSVWYYFSPGAVMNGTVNDGASAISFTILGRGSFTNSWNTVEITHASTVRIYAEHIETIGVANAALRVTDKDAIVHVECDYIKGEMYGMQSAGTVHLVANIISNNIGLTVSDGNAIVEGNIDAPNGLGQTGGGCTIKGDINSTAYALSVSGTGKCVSIGTHYSTSIIQGTATVEINGTVKANAALTLNNTAILILSGGTRLVIGSPATKSVSGPVSARVIAYNAWGTLSIDPTLTSLGTFVVQPWVQ